MTKIQKQVDCPLVVPIVHGEGDSKKEYNSLTIRRPAPGEMRGISLVQLVQMDIDAIIKIAPRITNEPISEADVSSMDPFDFGELAGRISGFFSNYPVVE